MPRSSMTRMVCSPSALSVASMACSPGSSASVVRTSKRLRWLAFVHLASAFPSAGEEACLELAAQAQVAFYLTEPAGQPGGIGQCRPQVVDVSVEAVLHAHRALATADRRLPRMRRHHVPCCSSTAPSFAFAAGYLGVQGIQPLLPQCPVAGQPYRPRQAARAQTVDSPLRLLAYLHQPGLAQHPQAAIPLGGQSEARRPVHPRSPDRRPRSPDRRRLSCQCPQDRFHIARM